MKLSTPSTSGALFDVSGVVPTNATWSEDIYFTQDGEPLDISGLTWKLTLRCDEANTNADVTLSTTDYLSVQTDTDSGIDRILRINVPAGQLAGYSGDYVCDLASQDVSDVVTLWAHGLVTLRLNPVSF